MTIWAKAARVIFVIAVPMVATGCTVALRAPVCEEGKVELPAGAVGSYQLTTSSPDLIQGGTPVDISGAIITLSESSDHYRASFFHSAAHKEHRQNKVEARRTLDRSTSRVSFGMASVGFSSVCRINRAYFAQTRQSDGTYTIARLDLSPNSLTLTPVTFDEKTLAGTGCAIVFVPQFGGIDEKGVIQFDSTNPTRAIVDNTGRECNRETLLALATPLSFGYTLNRIEYIKDSKSDPKAQTTWSFAKPSG